jgi:transposase
MMEAPMAKPYDLSKPLVALEHDSTLVAVVEMSGTSWLVLAIVPGVDRRPLQKLPVDQNRLFKQLEIWREEAARAGKVMRRIVVAFEAGRDGFWLARWLRARGVEVYVIHPASVAVPREMRRAKTDRLDTHMLMRALLGWLRGEPDCCRMVAIPTVAEEDARRPGREREHLVRERTRVINRIKATMARFGIRGFKPGLKNAIARLEELRTPEGETVPSHTRSELMRYLERLHIEVGCKVQQASRNAIIGGRESLLMEWSGRAPAPPAIKAGKGRQRQGARHVSNTQNCDRRSRH